MISYFDAKDIIEREIKGYDRKSEAIPLLQSINRVLAEEVIADTDLPPFDNSAVDGFGIRYTSEITQWNLIGEISAGNFHDYQIDPSSTVSIMTGGKLPFGVDTVIPLEDVRIDGSAIHLTQNSRFQKGMNVRKKGEDLRGGTIALKAPTLIRPQTISLLAACGKNNIRVWKNLTAGILCTGDELVDISELPTEDKIRATNLYSLLASAEDNRLNVINLGIVKDAKTDLLQSMQSALNDPAIDILITTGGVSVGKHDYLQEVLKDLGAEILFWRVNIKPGKPLLFARYRRSNKFVHIFGLPGNPVSAFVCFLLFVKPALLKLFGMTDHTSVTAVLDNSVGKKDSKRHFINGRIEYNNIESKYFVRSVGSSSSGNAASIAEANCFICLKEEQQFLDKGASVECILI